MPEPHLIEQAAAPSPAPLIDSRRHRWQRRLSAAGLAELVREQAAGSDERARLLRARDGREVCWTDTEAEPLVTVRIATYNRGPLIADRAIASALAQTYSRLEILVVGDACDEATARAVASVDDPRVRFVNLARRGDYPAEPLDRWRVAGTHPMNAALTLARGDWIAPLDDDDEFLPTHVEELLNAARSARAELVFSKALMAGADDWQVVGDLPLREGHISHGSVLYSAGLRFFRYSDTCWRLAEPADWNLWKRMHRAGVRVAFHPFVTYRHF